VTSDLLDKKTEECLFTHVPSGQHAVSRSPILDSSKIQLHLKEEKALKNLSIYVISTLSISLSGSPIIEPAIFFLYLFGYPSGYLPYHAAKPSIYTSICLSKNIVVYICLFSVYTHPTVNRSFYLTMPFSSAWE